MGSVISNNIKRLRKKCELTQKQLVTYLYVSPQAVSKWEAGKALPDTLMLPKLADIFHVPIDALFELN